MPMSSSVPRRRFSSVSKLLVLLLEPLEPVRETLLVDVQARAGRLASVRSARRCARSRGCRCAPVPRCRRSAPPGSAARRKARAGARRPVSRATSRREASDARRPRRRAPRPPSPHRTGRRSRRDAPRSAFRGRSGPPPGRRRPGEAARRPAGGGGAEAGRRTAESPSAISSVPRSEDVRTTAPPRPRPRWCSGAAGGGAAGFFHGLARSAEGTLDDRGGRVLRLARGIAGLSKGASSEGEGTAASGRGPLGLRPPRAGRATPSTSAGRPCGSLPVGRPASSARRPWRRRSRSTNVSFEISLNVSVTPRPAPRRPPRRTGYEESPSASCIASTARMSARSRLLYWITTGMLSKDELVRLEVVLEVLPGLEVLRQHRPLRVRDEDDAVDALEHHAARLVERRLAGDRRELEADLVALDVAELDGEQVEVDRPVGLRLEVQAAFRPCPARGGRAAP